jgi:Uma2 family endonuclease
MITSIDQLDENKKYSYADYLTWHNEEYWEILRGKVVKRGQTTTNHQILVGQLGFRLYDICKQKGYDLFFAPIDVCLFDIKSSFSDEFIFTVVQPDVCVICDLSKMEERGCFGAPDFIIEVKTKETSKKDLNDKFLIYQDYGVKEYWIISELDELIFVFDLDNNNKYQLRKIYAGDDTVINSKMIKEYSFVLKDLFSRKMVFN